MNPRRGRRPHNFDHTPDLEAARSALVDLRKRSKRLHHFSGGRGYDHMGARELEQLRTKIDEAEFWLSAATRSLNAGGERARRIAEDRERLARDLAETRKLTLEQARAVVARERSGG